MEFGKIENYLFHLISASTHEAECAAMLEAHEIIADFFMSHDTKCYYGNYDNAEMKTFALNANHSYRNSVGSGGDDPPPLGKIPPPPSTCGPQI